MNRKPFVALAVLVFVVVFSVPQPSLDKYDYVQPSDGPAAYVVTPNPVLNITGNDIYVKFYLKGETQTVHGIIYGAPLGSSDVIALYLPGFWRDAERSIEDFESRNRHPNFTLIVLDPPGKGETTGPAQELDNVLGDGNDPTTSYIRRYIEFAYATIKAFYDAGMTIEYVAGHSMGATTIMGLVTVQDPALEAVRFYAPMAISGFRLRSIHDGTFLNWFTKDPDRDTRLIKYFDVAAFPDKVRYKIVMINGMHDRVYSLRTMVRTADILGEKLVSHVLVPSAGHWMCKEFALSFEYRIQVFETQNMLQSHSEKVYVNDRLHYSGPIRLTPGDYVFSLYYVDYNGEKVYVSSEPIGGYSIVFLIGYIAIALTSFIVLAALRELRVALITVILGYRRVRAPKRFVIATFGKLFRRMVPLEILIISSIVLLSSKRRILPPLIILTIGNIITLLLMHSILLPGPYLIGLILLRLAQYSEYINGLMQTIANMVEAILGSRA